MTIEEHDSAAPEEELAVVGEDEEIGTTTRTVATTVSSVSASAAAAITSTTKLHHNVVGGGGGKDDLVWSGVTMKLLDRKTRTTKLNILKDVWGKAEAGKTTAIMGASGAGKTSLFQTLAGRVPSSSNLETSGTIYLGGRPFNPRDREERRVIAYVGQEDSLHESSTPRETLLFSARLRLPRTLSDDECQTVADRTLEALGLEAAADTLIGGGFRKGISGGEKRRVSIGVELVAEPSLLFLDEPTSGLDSFAAAQVMKLLGKVAHEAGNTVLFTIHQPSSNIFGTFDQLILLHKGRVMHQGAVASIGVDYEKHGFPVPNQYNPADWVIDVAQEYHMKTTDDDDDQSTSNNGFFSPEPPDLLAGISTDTMQVEDSVKTVAASNDSVSTWKEFTMLQHREMNNLRRNPATIVINVVVNGILSVIFGVIFLGVGRKDRADFSVIQSQLGAVVNVLIATLMGQSNPAMMTFSKDRPVFLREFSTDHYTIVPYFLSKLWSEALNTFVATLTQALVIYWLMGFQMSFGQLLAITYCLSLTATAVAVMLGACFTDISNALSLFTLLVVPQFYFSGLFIAIELIPSWVSWAQYLCSLTYAARLGFAYEFSGCEPGAAAANCASVLEANNVKVDDTWWYWLALLGLFVMFRVGGILILRLKATY